MGSSCKRYSSLPWKHGVLNICDRKCIRPRIIPADAGSTNRLCRIAQGTQDHPRGCGEHIENHVDTPGCEGSSPRMRGAQFSRGSCPGSLGIIPADAGSTNIVTCTDTVNMDHPRGCGEHCAWRRIYTRKQGSSPRMRGALPDNVAGDDSQRIIPADAGSTVRTTHSRQAGLGSSPRMRGAQNLNTGLARMVRIIPADAGSTETLACW